MCVLTNKINKTYLMRFLFCRLGYAPGMGLGGAGVKTLIFQNMVKWHIKLTGMISKLNASKILTQGQTGDLGVGSKGKYH